MPEQQASAYRRALETARAGGKGAVLAALQALRAVSLHPHRAEEAAADPEAFVGSSARWVVLFDILDGIAEQAEKVLVFLEAQALQPVLAALAQQRYRLGTLPAIINGAVAGDRRQRRVDEFQKARPGFGLLILGPRAAGIGLTLTAANHVVHLSRWWNPAVEDQCTDRVYRIGQSRPVTVWIPQAVFPDQPDRSFDRQLHQLLERKRALSRDLLAPPAATDRDAEELFRTTVG
jgi:SNF2 family DNA or RNA helicase